MPKRILIGMITSASMQQTARVQIDRKKSHRLYGKQFQVSKQYLVHNPQDQFSVGDVVAIEESRPLSKRKHWIIVRRISQTDPTPLPVK